MKKCEKCNGEIFHNKQEIDIPDKQGTVKSISYDYCEDCGDVTNLELFD